MKSITIHNLDDPLNSLIREKAKNEGLSLNNTIKKLLAEALGLSCKKDEKRGEDFLEHFGVWTNEELKEFNKQVGDFEKIDREDWA
jgi:plasmid stability protein